MPLNPPSQIDRRGLTPKVNFDGTYASEYPNGDKPEGEVPAAITGLAASPGPEQANLSWTPNGSTIKLYRRDDTAAGAFQLVTDQISGSANMYSDQGLVGENDYSYKMVSYNEFGDAPDSNVASVTTGAALGDAYQLAADQYSPSRFPLQWVNPNGDETSRSAFLWSHSEFDYVRRVTVTGGAPPYYFYLDEPVAGVTFTRQAPSWNPYLFLWADLVIDHTQFASGSKVIPLRCIDQEGTLISLSLTVTVDDSKFVVMAQSATEGSGSGTLADPYHDLDEIYTTSATDDTHVDKIIVGRSGTYTIDNFDTLNSALQMNEHKPCGWIPFPGESISFTNSANVSVQFTSGTAIDYYFGDATYNGGDTSIGNARVFGCLGEHARLVWDWPDFQSPVVGTSGTDNTSCIFFASSTGLSAHTNISIINGNWNDLPAASNGVSAFDFYGVDIAAVVGGTLHNSTTNYGAWLKQRNNRCMVAGFDGYDADGPDNLRVFNPKNGDGDLYTGGSDLVILGCKAYRSSDGLQNDDSLRVGDTNQGWGDVFMDRLSILAPVGFEGDAANQAGTAYMDSCIVSNDQASVVPAEFVTSNTVLVARSQASNYLDVDGNVLTGYAEYGKQGANYVAPEVV